MYCCGKLSLVNILLLYYILTIMLQTTLVGSACTEDDIRMETTDQYRVC